MAADDLSVKVDDRGMRELMAVLRKEADGKQLRRDLVKEIRGAVAPGISAVQGKLRSVPHNSGAVSKPAMRSYLAARVKSEVKLSGRSTGVRIKIKQTPQLRGFKLAARRLNRKHWRHKVFGRDVWVTQNSPIPGFFEDTLAKDSAKYRAAVVKALTDLSDRLTARRFGGL